MKRGSITTNLTAKSGGYVTDVPKYHLDKPPRGARICETGLFNDGLFTLPFKLAYEWVTAFHMDH